MRLWSTLAACSLAAAVSASELHPVDIRVTLMMAPETDNVDVSYRVAGIGASGETDNIGAGWRLEAGLVTKITELSPTFSLVGGGWFFYSDQENDEVEPGQRELDLMTGPMGYTTMGIDLYIAVNMRMGRYAEMEFGPFVGFGSTRYTDSGVEAGDPDGRVEETGHGDYQEAGLNLALTLRPLSRSFLFSLGVRYLTSYGEAENAFDVEDSNGNFVEDGLVQEVEIRQNGFTPYMTFGMTF